MDKISRVKIVEGIRGRRLKTTPVGQSKKVKINEPVPLISFSSPNMEKIKNQLEKIKKESLEIKTEVRQRTIGYIVAAFGLVAGLAWNEAIKALIEYLFPLSPNTLKVKICLCHLHNLDIGFLLSLFGKNI